MQEYVYGRSEDPTLRKAIRQGKSAAEFWGEASVLTERWDKIKKQVAEEQFQRGVAPPPSADTQQLDQVRSSEKEQLEETIRRGVAHALEPKSAEWFRARAYQQVRRYIRLIAEPDMGATLRTEISNSSIKDIKGIAGRRCAVILFDSTCHGEAGSNPMFRLPSLGESRLRKLVSAVLSARSSEGAATPLEGDVYMLFDGGRGPSAESTLLSPFNNTADTGSASRRSNKGSEVHVKKVSLVMDEASILKRRERKRSEHVAQTSTLYVVTASGLNVPRKDYNTYKGFSDRGNAISPIVLPALGQPQQFAVPAKDKKHIWGPHRQQVPGGQTAEDASAADSLALEPVCFHGLPVAFYKDLFEAHFVSGICDLTVGAAAATEAALALKVPYFGVCPTEFHAIKTMDFLAERMMSMMSDQTSSFYDPEVKARSEQRASATPSAASATPPPRATSTGTPAPSTALTPFPKPLAVDKKKKKKKSKKVESESESSSSSTSPSAKKAKAG